MSARVLTSAVVAGGKFYAAGTPAEKIPGSDKFAASLFTDGQAETSPDRSGDPGSTGSGGADYSDEFRSVVEYMAERHLGDPDVPVDAVLRDALEVFGTPSEDDDTAPGDASDAGDRDSRPGPDAADGSTAADPDGEQGAGPARISTGYDAHTATALKAEVDARNVDRDPDGEGYIKPDGRSKDALVAALTADDGNS